jgi:chromosome partitioning protein
VPSCANAAFVEFASAQYRHLNPEWTFFGAVSRFLDSLADDAYDLILFDCPPAIGYQSMNAVFAADMLYIPSGPGYWEYDSTTSFHRPAGRGAGGPVARL